jgi:hypothetical protein
MGVMKIYWVCIEAVQWSTAHGRLPGGHVFGLLAFSGFNDPATDHGAIPFP